MPLADHIVLSFFSLPRSNYQVILPEDKLSGMEAVHPILSTLKETWWIELGQDQCQTKQVESLLETCSIWQDLRTTFTLQEQESKALHNSKPRKERSKRKKCFFLASLTATVGFLGGGGRSRSNLLWSRGEAICCTHPDCNKSPAPNNKSVAVRVLTVQIASPCLQEALLLSSRVKRSKRGTHTTADALVTDNSLACRRSVTSLVEDVCGFPKFVFILTGSSSSRTVPPGTLCDFPRRRTTLYSQSSSPRVRWQLQKPDTLLQILQDFGRDLSFIPVPFRGPNAAWFNTDWCLQTFCFAQRTNTKEQLICLEDACFRSPINQNAFGLQRLEERGFLLHFQKRTKVSIAHIAGRKKNLPIGTSNLQSGVLS